jgi:competence protein ComEC
MWAAAAFAVFLILWSPIAGVVRSALRAAFPGAFQLIVGGAIGGAALTLLALAVVRVRVHRGWRFALIAIGLAMSVAYVAYSRTGNANVDVVEASHYVEYGVLVWLFYRVWRTRGDVSALALPLVAGLTVATLDEWLQWFVPERVGEMRDIGLDGVALLAGLLVSVGADPPTAWSWWPRPGSARRLAAGTAAGIGIFTLFFQSVHLAHDIRDPEFGSFLSCFDREGLAAAARTREVEWAAHEPGVPSRLSREDQFRSEAIWHVQRRNEDVSAGRFEAAWAENRILELYFAPALNLHGPRLGAGYRWPAEQRADVASRTAGARRDYVSDANPYPIYAWSRTTLWLVAGITILAILFAGAIVERRSLVIAAAIAAGVAMAPTVPTLDVYFIDVEGGQATLVVTPSRESMLIDAGWAGGRDANRVMTAIRAARLSRLDYLVVTHFHADHVGGVPELAARIPVRTFVDYGVPGPTDPAALAPYGAYDRVRADRRHVQPQPGDRLPLGDVRVEVVSAGGRLPQSGRAAREPAVNCAYAKRDEDPTENARSIGLRVEYGRFRVLDLGDLGWNMLWRLACPAPLLDATDVYLVPHHGNEDVNVPTLLSLLHPRVAIVNNGAAKGGAFETLAGLQRMVAGSSGLEDVWQLHRSAAAGDANTRDELTANLDDGATGFAIKIEARADGRFTVRNERNGFVKTYVR